MENRDETATLAWMRGVLVIKLPMMGRTNVKM